MKNKKKNKTFGKIAEEERDRLRQRGEYGSSSHLIINEEHGIAAICIQTSERGTGHDTIYVLRKDGELKEVIDRNFTSGRMLLSGISDDGKTLLYTIKDEQGEFHSRQRDISHLCYKR